MWYFEINTIITVIKLIKLAISNGHQSHENVIFEVPRKYLSVQICI